MVASSPQPQRHQSLMHTNSTSPVVSAKPAPPRTPSADCDVEVIGGVAIGGRTSTSTNPTHASSSSSPGGISRAASHGGGGGSSSLASHPSIGSSYNGARSSPEGRSVRTGGGSKGSVDNRRDDSCASSPSISTGVIAPISESKEARGENGNSNNNNNNHSHHNARGSPSTSATTAGSNAEGGLLANLANNGNGAVSGSRVSLAGSAGRSPGSGYGVLTASGGGISSNNNSNSNSNNNAAYSGSNSGDNVANTASGTAPANVLGTPPKSAPAIPKNPKDTAAHVSPGGGHFGVGVGGASPKRRMKSAGAEIGGNRFGVGGFAGSGGGSLAGAGTLAGGTIESARSVPVGYHRATGASAAVTARGGTSSSLSQSGGIVRHAGSPGSTNDAEDEFNSSAPDLRHGQGHAQGQSRRRHGLDDEEQFMFEQRLTQDELGVAIRKISHSGKAQLRYVKCVTLRPPSSSDFGEATGAGASGGGARQDSEVGARGILSASRGDEGRVRMARSMGDAASVSSRSSTGSRFGRMMRGAASARRFKPGGSPSGAGLLSMVSGPADLLLTDAHGSDNGSKRALTWGKKNAVTLPLDRFTCVRKGKTTERTRRNSSPGGRLLSVMTSARGNESLDIEAPTMLDRDKFASAFARFLGVPLVEEGGGGTAVAQASGAKKKIRTPSLTRSKKKKFSATHSEPEPSTPKVRNRSGTNQSDGLLPALTPTSDAAGDADRELSFDNARAAAGADDERRHTIGGAIPRAEIDPVARAVVSPGTTLASSRGSRAGDSAAVGTASERATSDVLSASARKRISPYGAGRGESMLEPRTEGARVSAPPPARERTMTNETPGGPPTVEGETDPGANTDGPEILARRAPSRRDSRGDDDRSHVSSLTGGVDQEIVEELHQAIIELRSELDASRAEAARAVKVAEQAIQSAENCTSSDWNSTVTHKAAEAAAQAQKKSAEAIARARTAEERLAGERRSTGFWRRQAQAAEEEAGSLKTRSAAAEVKQATMTEELAGERRKAARMFASLKSEFVQAEKRQGEEMTMVQERKRGLEVELEEMRIEMEKKEARMKKAMEAEIQRNEKPKGPIRMKPSFRRPRSGSRPREEKKPEKSGPLPESVPETEPSAPPHVAALQNKLTALRKQFELVRHTSMDEILSLHRQSEGWSNQASRAVAAATAETDILREKLAAEGAMRLKLLNELQDIRGTVRVYCRPRPCPSQARGHPKSIISIPAHDSLVINEDTSPLSFKYDRVFSPWASQYEVFSELEEPLISSLDGFNVTLLAFGQGGSGKTHTLLGDVEWEAATGGGDEGVDGDNIDDADKLPSLKSHGVQLQAVQQLFTIADHRKDRYKDAFSMTMVEVHNEKLHDLVAGTPSADRDGEVMLCETRDKRRSSDAEWRRGKLEIRTDVDGNTIVQGLVSVPVRSFEEASTAWREALARRAEGLRSQGTDLEKHGRRTSVITTMNVRSVNVATGVGTEGKLQFVDMASSEVVRGAKRAREDAGSSADSVAAEEDDMRFANKSIDAFNDVVSARIQFDRSVPYRNATLTHLLRDSLEADTKVLLMCCISSEETHAADTMGALRFASRMQKVSIGKATKHIIGSKE